MALFTLPQMIQRLTRGFVKVTGRMPDGLEKIKIKQEASERIKQQDKVVDMEGNVLDVTKPIIGGKQEGLERVAKTLEANQKRKLNTFKNLDDNKKLNADEIEELEEELGNVNDPDGPDLYEAHPEFDGTAGSAKKILKDSVEYEQSMFEQYKAGKLDPTPKPVSSLDREIKEAYNQAVREGRLQNIRLKDGRRIESEDDFREYIDELNEDNNFDFAQGGRAGFKIGGIDKARRAFLKAAAGVTGGIAALKTGLLNIGKGADTVKNLPPIKTPVTKLEGTTTQMPDWFPSFINKFRDEGKAKDVFKTKKVEVSKAEYDQAFKEGKGERYFSDVARTPEYKANNPDHMDYYKRVDTDERIYTTYTNDKVPGVRVDDMDGNVDVMFENEYSQPVSLNYTAPGKRGPETGRADVFVQGEAKMEPKPKGEFVANDVEVYATDPDGGSEAVDVIADTVDEMLEGTTRQMEEYATGKKTKMSSGEFRVGQAEARAEQAAEEAAEAADDFASGGIARMLGE